MVLERNSGVSNIDSCKQIIYKYINTRMIDNGVLFAHYEILGYLYKRLAKSEDNANQHLLSLLDAPFQEGILSEVEIQVLLENKQYVADLLCSQTDAMSRYTGLHMQPLRVTQLALSALKGLPEGTTIYNPYAGVNSYAIAAPQYHFVGEEISNRVWALGQIRLYMHGVKADIKIGDSCNRSFSNKFDAIICTPPFGVKEVDANLPSLYDKLNEGGILVFIYSVGLLYEYTEPLRSFRKRLLKDKSVRSVVMLPQNIYHNTSVQTALIVIEKKPHTSIRMIDGESALLFGSSLTRRKVNVIDLDELMRLLHTPDLSSDKVAEIEYDSFYYDDNLIPAYHLVSQKLAKSNFENLNRLESVLKIYRSSLLDSHNQLVRYVYANDLPDNIAAVETNFSALKPVSCPGAYKLLDKDNLLLVSPVGGKFRCAIFRKTADTPVICHSSIMVYELTQPSLDMLYLVGELFEPYVQKQINALSIVGFSRRITPVHFLKVLVNLPSLQDQKSSIELLRKQFERQLTAYEKQLLDKTRLLDQLRDEKHNNFVHTMRVRKHAIAQVLNSVAPAIDVLKMTLEKNGGVLKSSDVILRRSGTTLDGYLDRLQDQVTKIVTMIDVLTDDTEYGAPSKVSLYELIENYKGKMVEDKFSFEIVYTSENGFFVNKDSDRDYQHYIDYKISIDPKDFYQMLDNIISNAKKYGFVQSDKEYTIQVSAMPYLLNGKEAVMISVMNNGENLAKGMTPEKVFLIGEHAGKGNGIGGWQMKNIVEHYGGTIDLVNNTDDEFFFKIEYQIVLPIIESYEV